MNIFAFVRKFKTALPLITALLCLATLTAFSQKPEIYVQMGHSENVVAVAFSPDCKTVASGSSDTTIKLWDNSLGQEFRTLKGHTRAVTTIVFSRDGTTIASGSNDVEDRQIKLWNVVSGQEIRNIRNSSTSVVSMAFSPDGKFLATGSGDTNITLWDVESGQELQKLRGHKNPVNSVSFSPDGKTIASGSSDKTIKLWDVDTGKESMTLIGHLDLVLSVAFSPDGMTLASGGYGSQVKLWNIASGKETKSLDGHLQIVTSVVFDQDGRTLASVGSDNTLKLWDLASGSEIRKLDGFSGPVMSIAFSRDGRVFSAEGVKNSVKIWDHTSAGSDKILESNVVAPYREVISPDGTILATDYGNRIQFWNLISNQRLKSIDGRGPIAFSPDSKILAVGVSEGIALWDVFSGEKIRIIPGFGNSTTYRSEETSTASGKKVTTAMSIGGLPISIAFDPDGRSVWSVYVSLDLTIRRSDLVTGQELQQSKVSGSIKGIRSAEFSPDRKVLAISSYRYTALVDVSSGQELRSLEAASQATRDVIFSPDGKLLAACGFGPTKLWDVSTGRAVKLPNSIAVRATAFAFNSASTVVAIGVDKTISLVDIASGKELKSFTGHSTRVNSIALSSDGARLISGSDDATSKLWDVSSGKTLATMIALKTNDWVVVDTDGRFDGSSDGMKLISYVQDNKILPLDSFFEQFYRPNLLQEVYESKAKSRPIMKIGNFSNNTNLIRRERPSVDFTKAIRLPPSVRIVSPTPGAQANADTARIVIQADDQGGGVEDIRLYQNGKLLDDPTRDLTRETKANTRTFEVNLLPGVNTFRATAFNTDRTEATPYEIKIELKALEATANLYILAIGLNKYKNANYDLNYGRADAQAFADAIEKRGKGIFKEISKKVMFDAEATRGGIEAAFSEIVKLARPQDVFVFYYAGHGTMSEGDTKTPSDFYLVPHDVVRIFGDRPDLPTLGISATDLRGKLRKIKALKQLIVLDACESGGATEKIAMRGPAEQKAIMQLNRSAGVAVLASAGQEQTASEFAKLGHGVFTYALLEGLSGKADGTPMDGKVTVKELAAYLDDQVPELTKLYRGKRQDPNSSTRGQDFPIGIN